MLSNPTGRGILCAVSLFVFALAGAARADNQIYKCWAKQPVGTTVKAKAVDGDTKVDLTLTLKKVGPDEVVLQMTIAPTEKTDSGKSAKQPKEQTGEKKISAQRDVNNWTETFCNGTPKGTEDVKVGDKTFHCKILESEVTMGTGGGKLEHGRAKVWVSEDMPGYVVKEDAEIKYSDNLPWAPVKFEALEVTQK